MKILDTEVMFIIDEPRATLWSRLRGRIWVWKSRLKKGPIIVVKSKIHEDDTIRVVPKVESYFIKGFECAQARSETTMRLAAWLGETGVRIDYMIDGFFEGNPRLDFMKINAATLRFYDNA